MKKADFLFKQFELAYPQSKILYYTPGNDEDAGGNNGGEAKPTDPAVDKPIGDK